VKRRSLSLSLVLCISLMIAGARTGTSQQVQPLEPEWLRQMYEEGWHKVQEGVLQRDTGGGQLETFGYGSEGLQWIVQGYEQRVTLLEDKYSQSPTMSLALAIAQLKGEITRLNETLTVAPSVDRFDNAALETCAPAFGGEASAGPQAGPLGAEASASAYFYSDCGQLGDTFATAYAHAIDGTVETTKIQSDPKNAGTWLDSQAIAGANGSTGCESSAQASVTSSELSISYQILSQNFRCSAKLTLDPSRITLDGAGSSGDPRLLADEQIAAGDPRAGTRNQMTTNWGTIYAPHANAAIIDLGGTYRIERIYLYDSNGVDRDFTVAAGSPASGWTTPLISDAMAGYLTWKGFPNDPANDPTTDGAYTQDDPALEFSGVTTRYLRVVNPTGYLGVPEIVVYGTPVTTP
jgi:hypothetical protein